ncbi:MAG: hypothetical protein H6Q67_389 [Firmicutes bacterium]|nr:hypothetical protein [Bacillota bacterium]
MTEAEAVKELQRCFNSTIEDKSLLVLHAIKEILQSSFCTDKKRREQGLAIIGLASKHTLTDSQLLNFFETTMEAVFESAGEDNLKEHGLYKILATSPTLSPVCKLFFDAWTAVYYKDHPLKCQFRRVGLNAYRLVAILPDGNEQEYLETITAEEAVEYSNCPLEDLQAMPILQ